VLVVVVAGAMLYLLVALRAWEPHAWGGGDGLNAWLFHVRAGGYAGNVSFANLPANIRPMAAFYLAADGPMALAAVAGLAALADLRRVGPIAFLWSLVLLVSVFAGAVNTPIDGNPDAQGYVLVAIAALCALPGVCAGALRPLFARWRATAAYAPRAPLVAVLLFAGATAFSQLVTPVPTGEHPGWSPRDYGTAMLDSTPPRGILLTHGDHEVFPPIYLQGIEGARPDVAVIATGLLSSTWYLHGIKLYYPWLSVPYEDAPAPPSAGDDFRDTVHRGLIDDNPKLEVTAADSVYPVSVDGWAEPLYRRVPLRRMVDALVPTLPYEAISPTEPTGIPPGTWRGDALVVERALYDVAVRAATEGDRRALPMLAILAKEPEPDPAWHADPGKLLNARVDRLNSAFLFMREIALGAYGDALHAAGRHAEGERALAAGGEHGLRAVWEARLGHIDVAKEALDAAVIGGGDAVNFAVLAGDVCAEDGQKEWAAAMYEEAGRRSTTDPYPMLRLGVLKGNAGDLDAAEKAFTEAVARDATMADPHVMLGIIHAKRGHLDAAKAEFQKALDIDPDQARARALLDKSADELKTADIEE